MEKKKEQKFGINCCGCAHANTGWCYKCVISGINGRPTCYLHCSEAGAKSIKMLTDWCSTCTNRKTCAIDEGFREDCSYNGTSIPTLWELDKTVNEKGKPSPREEILREAIKCVCTDRNQQYGEPEDSFRCIADLWNAYLKPVYPDICITPAQASMMMMLFKAARDAVANVHKIDTYVDMCGYAACAGGMIE